MSDEYVSAPDQHKPERIGLWRVVWILITALILIMLIGNHTGRVEDIWVIGSAGIILIGLVADAIMRKRGWKPRA